MPPISSPYWVSQALTFSSASGAVQLATWKSSSLTSGFSASACSRPGPALDRGRVGEDAAQGHDAALAAHGLEQRLGHGLAVGHAVERDVRDVVRVVVPGVQVGGLVPLGHDVGAGLLAGFDDRPRVRAVVRVDVEHEIAAGLGEQRLDVGDALLAVALGDQRHVVGADRSRERGAALVPRGVIGVGERADRVGDGRLVGGEQPARARSRQGGHGGGAAAQHAPAIPRVAQAIEQIERHRLPPWRSILFSTIGTLSDADNRPHSSCLRRRAQCSALVEQRVALRRGGGKREGERHGRYGFGPQGARHRGGRRARSARRRGPACGLRRRGGGPPRRGRAEVGLPRPFHARLRCQGRLPRRHPAPAPRARAWPARWRARASWRRRLAPASSRRASCSIRRPRPGARSARPCAMA